MFQPDQQELRQDECDTPLDAPLVPEPADGESAETPRKGGKHPTLPPAEWAGELQHQYGPFRNGPNSRDF